MGSEWGQSDGVGGEKEEDPVDFKRSTYCASYRPPQIHGVDPVDDIVLQSESNGCCMDC